MKILKFILYFIVGVLPLSAYASVSILMYHNIGVKPLSTSVTLDNFSRQMDIIRANNIKVISSVDFENRLSSGDNFLEDNYVVITFDDGWKSQYGILEILRSHNFSATFFINGEPIERKSKVYLSKKDLITMAENPDFLLASHSYTHNYKLSTGKNLKEDFELNFQFLKEFATFNRTAYAYPYGIVTPLYSNFLKENGITYAYGVRRGRVSKGQTDKMNIPRFDINSSVTDKDFLCIVKHC